MFNTDTLAATRTFTFPDASGTFALAGSSAPSNASYVTLALNGSLSDERVLTGTSNQVVITDNGAGSTVVLSLPQNIHTAATPTFASLNLTATTNQILLVSAALQTGQITTASLTGSRTWTLPDKTGTIALLENTLNAFAATTSAELATVISDETGTGALVFANTPTLVTPVLGAATGTSLALTSTLVAPIGGGVIANATTPLTYDSTYYGKTHFWSPAGTATATLPANGAAAGSWFDVVLLTNQTITISAATADTLITVNDTTADSVAFSTTNSKTGSMVRFISNGTVWIAVNVGSTAMTVNT